MTVPLASGAFDLAGAVGFGDAAVPVLPLLGLPADVAGLADTTGEDEAAGGNGA